MNYFLDLITETNYNEKIGQIIAPIVGTQELQCMKIGNIRHVKAFVKISKSKPEVKAAIHVEVNQSLTKYDEQFLKISKEEKENIEFIDVNLQYSYQNYVPIADEMMEAFLSIG